jgi:O-antigen/teichoic acid export membrane protein
MSSRKLLTGSALRVGALIIGMAISFLMMPFLIRTLGDHWYGLWILVASTLGFYGVFDFGLASATQRYISHALGQQDETRLNQILSNSIFIYTFIALIAVIASVAIAFSADLFFDNPEDSDVFRTIILVMGCTFAIHFVMNAYYGILTAYLRFDIQASTVIVKSVFRALTIFLVFQSDPSVINLALITVLYDLISHLIILRAAKREAPWIAPRLHHVSKENMAELVNFGFHSFVMFIGSKLRERGPHFAVAGVLSIGTVTVFQIATQLIQYLAQLQSALLGVLLPSFTRLFGEGKNDELNTNYLFTLKISTLTASCLAGGIIALGQPFILFWIGDGYDAAYYTLVPLAIGYFVVLLHYPSFQLIVALAKHKTYSRYEVLEGIALTIATIIAAKIGGLTAVGWAICIILVIGRSFFIPQFVQKAWGISVFDIQLQIIKRLLLVIPAQITLWYALKQTNIEYGFLTTFLLSIPMFCIYIFIYQWVVFSSSERKAIKKILGTYLVPTKIRTVNGSQ